MAAYADLLEHFTISQQQLTVECIFHISEIPIGVMDMCILGGSIHRYSVVASVGYKLETGGIPRD